jgi:type II secretory pathway component GspD/PulD (secretin)
MGTGVGGGAGTAGNLPVQLGDRAKVLVLGGTPVELDQAERLLGQVDAPPHQVMVEVKVIDAEPEKIENIGVQYSWNPFQWLEAPVGSTFTPGNPPQGPTNTVKPIPLGPLSRVPWAFQAIVNLMVQRNEAKLLADPRVQVIDDQDADIFIGQTIRTTVAQASISGTTIQVLEFPVGIILLVHPRINSEGNLTLRVHPVVSTVISLGTNGVPNTASREAETTVMIKDGETMVIGGLIQDEVSKSVQEIPFLSKIPLIGELFRNRSTDHRHSDVLVFITPHIVK